MRFWEERLGRQAPTPPAQLPQITRYRQALAFVV